MKKTLFFTIILLVYSCKSQIKKEGDYNAILNDLVKNELKIRDSIFLFDPKQKEVRNASFMHYLKNSTSEISSNIKAFLIKNSIYLEQEIGNFEEQNQSLLSPIKKIENKRIKYLQRPINLKDTIKYMKFKYMKYTFHLPKPIFTKDKKYALVDYYSKGGGLYLLIYKNKNGNWKEVDRLYYLRF